MLKTRIRLSSLILAILVLAPSLSALSRSLTVDQYGHTAWTLRDGSLPAHPRSIAQTSDGYLWLATESGLQRFDGSRFVRWRGLDGSQLPSDVAIALSAGPDGSLWVGTTQGLSRLKDGRFHTSPELRGHHVGALLQTRDGTVWAGTNGGTGNALLCVLRETSSRCYGSDGSLGRFVLSLHEDRDGNVWLGTTKGLLRWSEGARTPYPTPRPSQEIHAIVNGADASLVVAMSREVRSASVSGFEPRPLNVSGDIKPTSLLRDRDGALWIGTQNQGVLHVRNGHVDNFDRAKGLSSDFVLSLFEDREGNIWVGTVGGLDRFRNVTAARLSAADGLASDTVMSVTGSVDGSVWLATVAGLHEWRSGRVTRRVLPGLLSTDAGGSLLEDSRKRLWVSSLRGLAYLPPNRQRVEVMRHIPTRYVHTMVEDRAGNIWIGDQSAGLFRVRDSGQVDTFPPSMFNGDHTRAAAADPDGGVWLGFARGGVAYFNAGRIEKWFGAEDGLSGGRVNGLHVDRDGTLWVATQQGLSRIVDGRIDPLRAHDGLVCEAVQWVMEDDFRAIWLHTACGLVHVTRHQLESWRASATGPASSTVYSTADGVLQYADLGGYGPKVTRAQDGRLWFATYDGVGVIDPKALPFNALPPPVHIEQVTADLVAYPQAARLRLPPLLRDLRIDFTALSLVAPEKVQFRYKLEGRDQEWIDAGSRRQAFYTDLQRGEYRFQVIASNNHAVWNDSGAVIDFSIAPAFHQTWPFRSLLGLVLTVTFYVLYRIRMARLVAELNMRFEERLAERTRIAQDLHDTLLQGMVSSSMQLHFVAEDTSDPDARSKLKSIIHRISGVIEEGRRTVTGLREPLPEHLEKVFARDAQNLRGDAAVDVQLGIKGERRPLHPLVRDAVYQVGREALANAFKHARAKRIEIEMEFADDAFKLFVRDNGCGVDAQLIESGRSGHWGMQDMRERAGQVGGTLKLLSRPNAGTEVNLTIPGRLAFGTVTRAWWQSGQRLLSLLRSRLP
jgi:signal transduction histidine kinase/ligand-binding sensor domain-containing protein